MNKVKVNMAVEPNDIQTLHCSQYDTEERKFSVDLHENGVGVSPSSISNQLVYKSFKGGTEQILPTNTSTPSTSPIIADINYKDGLREDEEFLYRESPSSVDGYAKIKEIRGNTLVWNQLRNPVIQSGTASGLDYDMTSDGKVYIHGTSSNASVFLIGLNIPVVKGHKYLLHLDKTFDANRNVQVRYSANGTSDSGNFGTYYTSSIFDYNNDTYTKVILRFYFGANKQINDTFYPNVFDLTQMFGSGNEPSTVADFEALFPLSNYSYTQGELVSFGENKLKFNQLVDNGNFATSARWSGQTGTVSISDSVCSFTLSSNANYVALRQNETAVQTAIVGHKYLAIAELKSPKDTNVGFWLCGKYNSDGQPFVIANTRTRVSAIINYDTSSSNYGFNIYPNITTKLATNDVVEFYYVMLIDLSVMFGVGKEPTAEEFRTMFPNDYYAYDTTGTILDHNVFMKTVGFNQWDEEWEQGRYDDNGTPIADTSRIRTKGYISVLPNTEYYIKVGDITTVIGTIIFFDASKNKISTSYPQNKATFTTPNNCYYILIAFHSSYGATYKNDICINISSSENGHYEPYTESILPMPITQYFPTGLKSAGSIYDQLDETGYVTRVGEIVLDGTQTIIASNFQGTSPKQCRIFVDVPNVKGTTATSVTDTGIISSYLVPSSNVETYNGKAGIHRRSNGTAQLCVSLGADGYDSGITTEALFNQYLASHPLTVQYEIGTPLENYGVVDLGSLSWTKQGAISMYYADYDTTGIFYDGSVLPNILCNKYLTCSANTMYGNRNGIVTDKVISVNNPFISSTVQRIIVADTTYSSASDFKTAMSGIYLLYEKVNPQGFTTASIVTNYGEMPLYNDNGELKADCIADVSANSGFQIAKVKLKDENGEIYSNPFQFHIERSPQ